MQIFDDIPGFFSENCRQICAGWLKSTNLQFSRCYIFVRFGSGNVLLYIYEHTTFWISDDTNKDDLE